VADIPGLIEGAHKGKGLGIQFLRHVQRTALLLFLIDTSDWVSQDPIVAFQTLQNELQAYDPLLLDRPFAIVATKIDSQGNGQHVRALESYCHQHHYPFFPISAITREGLSSLVIYLGKAVMEAKTSCASRC